MSQLQQIRVAILAMDGFEEVELTEPKKALDQNGATTEVISAQPGVIQGFQHHDPAGKVPVDRTLDQASPGDYDALLLPGGALNADAARSNPKVRQFLREFDRAEKPIAALCHAPWELISAGLVEGRTLTSWPSIEDDIVNAGGDWVDQEVVVDQNWVTSRGPRDLPAFNREMITLFSRVAAESHR